MNERGQEIVLKNVPINDYSKMKYSQTTHRQPLTNFANPMECLWKFSNLAAQDNSENF